MPDNRQLRTNVGVVNPSLGELEESVKRLKFDDQNVGDPFVYPDRPGEPDCIYYLRTGQCGYGNNCRFNHPSSNEQGRMYGGELPERTGQPDCVYYLKTGTCKYGSTCKYHHPPDRRGAGPVLLNILGLPTREEEKACPFYMRNGYCKFGAACKFHHPEPASSSSSSTFIPSSAAPWPYQNYVPVVLPPPAQSINSTNGGWNAYTGPYVQSGLDMNYYNLLEQGSNPMPMMPSPVIYLPERPDKPECRNFISTGNCKYGMDCKYHHPKERAVQLSMNPYGLPSRPGQAVCSYYSLNGYCKYGSSCKYLHTLPGGYSYNYMGVPFPNPMNSSSLLVYTSPTKSPSKVLRNQANADNGKDQDEGQKQHDDDDEESNQSCSPSKDISIVSESREDKMD
ncbi:zinc finger CCCH domain-containing protein 6-like [Impatiens glandulifera]|uniref:zinc finger CCCH domain-containing protein 6-like n=1 Tax=Impatiens glandulifera TaxID=253017 RepID=UPI001FB0A979|nr:zinc finger CCCH domain-containing protein 6-like [Impatiens glandulifera]